MMNQSLIGNIDASAHKFHTFRLCHACPQVAFPSLTPLDIILPICNPRLGQIFKLFYMPPDLKTRGRVWCERTASATSVP